MNANLELPEERPVDNHPDGIAIKFYLTKFTDYQIETLPAELRERMAAGGADRLWFWLREKLGEEKTRRSLISGGEAHGPFKPHLAAYRWPALELKSALTHAYSLNRSCHGATKELFGALMVVLLASLPGKPDNAVN